MAESDFYLEYTIWCLGIVLWSMSLQRSIGPFLIFYGSISHYCIMKHIFTEIRGALFSMLHQKCSMDLEIGSYRSMLRYRYACLLVSYYDR